MRKTPALKPDDHVALVSLSSGVLGENFAAHELARGKQRLRELGLVPVPMANALKGLAYLEAHPEARGRLKGGPESDGQDPHRDGTILRRSPHDHLTEG